jgi:hypothetical protein
LTPDDFVFDDPAFQPPPARASDSAAHTHNELLRAAQNIGQRLDEQHEDLEDDEAALRWRRALLRLSETFLDAAQERRDLSPILLSALQNALEQLLVHGEEADLMALEEWLGHEVPSTQNAVSDPARKTSLAAHTLPAGIERRALRERRSSITDRRQGDRRTL